MYDVCWISPETRRSRLPLDQSYGTHRCVPSANEVLGKYIVAVCWCTIIVWRPALSARSVSPVLPRAWTSSPIPYPLMACPAFCGCCFHRSIGNPREAVAGRQSLGPSPRCFVCASTCWRIISTTSSLWGTAMPARGWRLGLLYGCHVMVPCYCIYSTSYHADMCCVELESCLNVWPSIFCRRRGLERSDFSPRLSYHELPPCLCSRFSQRRVARGPQSPGRRHVPRAQAHH